MNEAAALAQCARGAMVAAAGCGKTQVIAAAVASSGAGRELVLTHTHAGVEALRSRLRRLEVPAARYEVETIAGWTLRLATAFPATARIANFSPRDSDGYSAVYGAAERLLRLSPIREIIRASYSGVFVDEYQDCTLDQHAVVLRLLEVLPCRVVGDPLQGIFDFGENRPIRWPTEVDTVFRAIDGPTVPWRWRLTNPALGEWLRHARSALASGQALDLAGAPVTWYEGGDSAASRANRIRACYEAAGNDGESVIALQKWSRQGHSVARCLGGLFSSIEPIDPDDLYGHAERISAATGCARAVAVLDFAADCMTNVNSEFSTIRSGLENERFPRVRKHAGSLVVLTAVASDVSLASVEPALAAIQCDAGGIVYRRELLFEMKRALRAVVAGDAATLAEAAWSVRNRARRVGRMISRCSVGTTLLVKGLEFDHVVVLDGDVFDAHNLYVAITRGTKSLTIVAKSRSIVPTSSPSVRIETRSEGAEGTR